ncbi:hypothetical protein Ssi03_76630 [Sphaerisporangium siamense]|nr:hypothetical protein Ssi03_76630 [Sphaerisporangium siamense]
MLGREYDVWDAHTNEGRWWVVTNPMNLYNQETIKSMDVALSFHIGLTSRVMSKAATPHAGEQHDWALDSMRRLTVAHERLENAKEREDFQAVGMRLREALVSVANGIASLLDTVNATDRPKASDFKGWAELAASNFAAGASAEHLRALLKASSEKTWGYVNWLTHARNATPLDGQIAYTATSDLMEIMLMTVARWRIGSPPRCSACGSYQLDVEVSGEEETIFRSCSVCHQTDMLPIQEEHQSPSNEEGRRPKPEGDCIVLDDFEVYLSPNQARATLKETQERIQEDEIRWANPFTFDITDERIADAHRCAFYFGERDIRLGAELVYQCLQDGCINPDHVLQPKLPDPTDWRVGVVVEVIYSPNAIYLEVGLDDAKTVHIEIPREVLEIFGIADVSVLLERLIIFSPTTEGGQVDAILSCYRYDYSKPSIITGRTVAPFDDQPNSGDG